MSIRNAISLSRPEHWVKNFFLFLPAFFAARLLEWELLRPLFLGFLSFSLMASAVYVLNDWVDAPQDRNHPEKRGRPIARGMVGRTEAVVYMLSLFIFSALLASVLSLGMLLIVLAYFFSNVFYSLFFKHIAIMDVSFIGFGFLLRVLAGGAVSGVAVSHWLLVLTFLLALILGLSKRRSEYLVATGGQHFRKALDGYNLPFIDMAIMVCSTVAIVAYLMYCFSPEVTGRIGSDKIYFTAFFVILGVLRYLQLTLVFGKTESPTHVLLRDVFLQILLLCWFGIFAWLLYGDNISGRL